MIHVTKTWFYIKVCIFTFSCTLIIKKKIEFTYIESHFCISGKIACCAKRRLPFSSLGWTTFTYFGVQWCWSMHCLQNCKLHDLQGITGNLPQSRQRYASWLTLWISSSPFNLSSLSQAAICWKSTFYEWATSRFSTFDMFRV